MSLLGPGVHISEGWNRAIPLYRDVLISGGVGFHYMYKGVLTSGIGIE